MGRKERKEKVLQQGGSLGDADAADDDVYYSIGERPKLEWETESRGVGAKKRGRMKAVVLMATPCTKSLGGGSGGHKRQ